MYFQLGDYTLHFSQLPVNEIRGGLLATLSWHLITFEALSSFQCFFIRSYHSVPYLILRGKELQNNINSGIEFLEVTHHNFKSILAPP